jgi:uracil-DNA glycosylase family 4
MKTYVPPEGNTAAKVVLIGEAPAAEEERKGKPFQGSAGKYLNQFLEMAGLYRGELYLTNILKHRAPGDKISRAGIQELAEGRAQLIEEINNLEGPKVLVPLGSYALETVTSKTGITNYRGSVLRSKDVIKHDCIVVPTFHPSILHYSNYNQWPLIVADLTKVARLQKEDFEFPEYNFIVQPSFEKVFEILDWLVETRHEIVVIDVETPHSLLSCIGLAWSRFEGICIPLYWGNGSDYWSFEQETSLWEKLSDVLPKLNLAGQNVFFDWEIMHNHGIELKMAKWDSMLMHGCLYSELPHNLETIISIYTDMEFYKRDDDEETKRSSIRSGMEHNHWEYNLMDCVGTLWSIEEMIKELKEENMLNAYTTLYANVLEPYFRMNLRGIPVDMDRLPEVYKSIEQDIARQENEIEAIVGHPVNSASPKQVASVLYDELGWEPYYKKGTKSRTTDKKALEKLAYKYQSPLPTLIAELKEDKSFLSLFSEDNIEDGCFRCSYSLGRTKTGRLSSRKSYSGKGRNLQNVKRGAARTFFVAEKGHIIVGADQKQAEARIVAYYSKDENYIRVAESGKIHLFVGAIVYDNPGFSKDDPNYVVVKSLVHGCVLGDHEVLTQEGWIKFKDLQEGVSIAQWDNGKISFIVPEILKYDYDGKMVHLTGTAIDVIMTPDHRLPYITANNYVRDILAKDLNSRDVRIPVVGNYNVAESLNISNSMLSLIVAIQADGSISYNKIRYHLVKERKISRLRFLLNDLQIPFADIPCDCHVGGRRIAFDIKDLHTMEFLLNSLQKKTFSYNLMHLSQDQRLTILTESVFWDGSSSQNKRNTNHYITTNEENAIFMQTLAAISGTQTLLRYSDRPGRKRLYSISFNNRTKANTESCDIKEVDHKGKIYCVRVPSSYFMIRYNNRISITGNSDYRMGPFGFAHAANIPLAKAKTDQAKFHSSFPGIVDVYYRHVEDSINTSRTLYNPFGRRQVFFDHIDESVYKAGCAFIPQSTSTDLTKIALNKASKHYRVLLDLHDGLYISVPKDEWKAGAEVLLEAFDIPISIWGIERKIPVELSIGPSWGEMDTLEL